MNDDEPYTAKEAAFRLLQHCYALRAQDGFPAETLDELEHLAKRYLNHLAELAVWIERMEDRLHGWSLWKR